MAEYYFNKFPTMTYADLTCTDITRRVGLTQEIRNIPTVFYPYEVPSGTRSDLVAYAYYKDTYLDWLIYLTNGIIDPYYGWYLSENDFEEFLKEKYGSVEESQRRIKHYLLNWSDDDIDVSVDFYNTALPEVLKKYYTPSFGQGSRILSYKRREEDWMANTNRIVNFVVNVHSNAAFSNGELVNTGLGGRAEIIIANSTVVTVQHVSGNTDANTTLTGLTSGANASILDTDLVTYVIDPDEFVYWTPVTMFDWEQERNEEKKQIYLLDANWALEASEQLRIKLKE